jgi:leucine rich repeat (LRR) protein
MEREARDHTTPPDRLTELARSRSVAVRAAVADNPATPIDALGRLAEDTNNTVLRALAASELPEQRLAAAHSSKEIARVVAAQHEDLADDASALLLDDASPDVRRQLSYYTRTPWVFERLVADPHPEVRRETMRNPLATPTLALLMSADADVRVRKYVPFCNVASRDLVDSLADDPRAEVRACVADSRRASPETLARLVTDSSSRVRWNVLVNNPDRVDLGRLLVDDPDEIIAVQARAQVEDPRRFTAYLGAVDLVE